MVFSSLIFLFLFLPLFLGLYYLALLLTPSRRGRPTLFLPNLVILASSLLFYTWGEKRMVLIMLGSTVIDYLCGLVMTGALGKGLSKEIPLLEKGGPRTPLQRCALVFSLASNLGLLGFFKYFNFFLDNFNSACVSAGFGDLAVYSLLPVALPVGISFYTFQSMSYTIDVYRGEVRATRNLVDFACFVTLFPQLIAGPIVRYKTLATQLIRRTVTLEGFSEGIGRFIVGLGKKVLIADVLALPADRIYAIPENALTPALAWTGTVCFTLQLYYDFSGYSDMAIGLGRMLGFRFPENFNYPFIAQSIREYWSRWHISLGKWFRDYLFFPLGGSRRGTARTYANLLTVFFLCGLWHGARWTFVYWGLFHGAFLIAERLGFGAVLARLWRPLRHLYCCGVNLASKVLFRAAGLGQAGAFFVAMIGLQQGEVDRYRLGLYMDVETWTVLAVGILGATPALSGLLRFVEERFADRDSGFSVFARPLWSFVKLTALFGLLTLSVMWMANTTYHPFIYFRF